MDRPRVIYEEDGFPYVTPEPPQRDVENLSAEEIRNLDMQDLRKLLAALSEGR